MPALGKGTGAHADAETEETALEWVRSVPSFWRNQLNPDIEGIFPSGLNPFHSISNQNSRSSRTDPGLSHLNPQTKHTVSFSYQLLVPNCMLCNVRRKRYHA